MNSSDLALQYSYAGSPLTGNFAVTQFIAPLLYHLPEYMLEFMLHWGWWGHLVGVLFFVVYLPYSKHLHIFLAFPNTFFSRFAPKGKLNNMPEVTKEVQLMLNPNTAFAAAEPGAEVVKFGAKDVTDLSWKNLLDAYSCTECGRCTAACPANLTGKKLSPRKIMMDVRDRAEELSNQKSENENQKSLLHDYITVEELRACTTCNACVEECPVNISPLDIIMQLRRNLILEESNSPDEWNMMFGNIENNAAPWQVAQSNRAKWSEEIFN